MKIIGITGGIASGKSTVSSYLEEKYKAYIFDADKEAKALLQSSFVKDKILKSFPNLKDVSNESIAEEVFKKLEEAGIDPVLFGLTDKDFEMLAKNFAQIRQKLQETNNLLEEYKKYYEGTEKESTENK